MKQTIRVQSVSDIITNSSSEVFICTTNGNQDELATEVQEFIDTLMKVLGYENDEFYTGATVEVAKEDGKVEDFGYKYNKGDLLIWSKDENSIPWNIVGILEDLDILPKFEDNISDVTRHHLG